MDEVTIVSIVHQPSLRKSGMIPIPIVEQYLPAIQRTFKNVTVSKPIFLESESQQFVEVNTHSSGLVVIEPN